MAITISGQYPAPSAQNASRRPKIAFTLQAGTPFPNTSSVVVRARQTPYGPISPDGWETLVSGGVLQSTLIADESVLEVDSVDDTQINASLQLAYAWYPGSTIDIEVTAEEGTTPYTFTWDFNASPYVSEVEDRTNLLRYTRRAYARGWDALIEAKATRTYSPGFTGSDLEVTVNESLVADIGDQALSSSAPDVAANPREYKLLVKNSGYAVDPGDPLAEVLYEGAVSGSIPRPVFPDRTAPGDMTTRTFTDDERTDRQRRYYTLFMLMPPSDEYRDWTWAWAEGVTTAKAYSFGSYGHGLVMFLELSRRIQREDQS